MRLKQKWIGLVLMVLAANVALAAAPPPWESPWMHERYAEADAALTQELAQARGGERVRRLLWRIDLASDRGEIGAPVVDEWLKAAEAERLPKDPGWSIALALAHARILAERGRAADAQAELVRAGEGPSAMGAVWDAMRRLAVHRVNQNHAAVLALLDALPANAYDGVPLASRWRLHLAGERAYAERGLGKPALAAATAESALAEQRRDFPDAGNLEARLLFILAYARLSAGDTAGSIALEREGAARLARTPEPDQPLRTRFLEGLCEDLNSARAHDEAERTCDEAAANERAHPSPNPVLAVSIGMARGMIANSRKDFPEAVKRFEAALALLEQRLGSDHPYASVLLSNLGNALLAADRNDEGAAVLARGVKLKERLGGANAPELVAPLSGLAVAQLHAHRYAEAEQVVRRAQAIMDRPDAMFFDWQPRMNASLSRTLWGQDRMSEALAAAERAQALRRQLMLRNIEALPESIALDYGNSLTVFDDLNLRLALLSGSRDALARYWSAHMAQRGLVTYTMGQRLALAHAAKDENIAASYRHWRELREAANKADTAHREQAERAADDAEIELAKRVQALALSRRERALGFGQLVTALPPHSALLTFVHSRFDTPDYDPDDRPTRHRLIALVLEQGAKTPRAVDLGDWNTLSAAIDAWTASLRNPESTLATVRAQGATVRERVWDPLQLKGSLEQLFVVPEGNLNRLNFAALPDGEGWLAQTGPRIQLLDHERDLLLEAQRKPAIKTALLAGAPQFGDGGIKESVTRDAGCWGLAIAPLPAAQREIDVLSGLLRAADYVPVDTLTGGSASADAVLAAMTGRSIVHLATHSLQLGAECVALDTRAILPPKSKDAPSAVARRGALAFAGAQSREDSSLLDTDEVAGADLRGTDLAVLSACDTGTGPLVDNEGVIGLARAFRLAGARRVVVSLWQVDDVATASFMTAFYRSYLAPKHGLAGAMQDAQRAVLAQADRNPRYAHPFYWAAFVARGQR